ncbi:MULTISPECIES: hypothetical protein [Microbacterium]|uniref:hypothetical protein n=1 Tax=Microbacterium TaxID=33882 RepID=UPI00217E6AAF|nr:MULTISPECIES: hypothetical protein [Microbacterium]UWF77538.1 hypothetical protein JSY13_00090 [Microbacterium neungamense]WCM55707.1 hypothetical protein JRG78_00090 [Microbacterium sp. EF45047]
MADVLRLASRDAADVEEIWTRYVPSARVQNLDPKPFGFQWCSVSLGGMSIVRYALTATVDSAVQPEDQLFACRVTTPNGWVRSGRSHLDTSVPWATDGAQVEAHWEGTADVSALVFDRAEAQRLARRITGDDLLRLRLTDAVPRDRTAGRHWNRAFDYLLSASAAAGDDPLIESSLVRHALLTTLSTFRSTFFDAAVRDAGGGAPREALERR